MKHLLRLLTGFCVIGLPLIIMLIYPYIVLPLILLALFVAIFYIIGDVILDIIKDGW